MSSAGVAVTISSFLPRIRPPLVMMPPPWMLEWLPVIMTFAALTAWLLAAPSGCASNPNRYFAAA